MPGERQGQASYPLVAAVEACQYTTGHGITPGTAILRCSPQAGDPGAYGDLVISDGVGTVTIPNCRLENIVVGEDSNGRYWNLTLSDRRWRWGSFGLLNGCYNQLDPHGKLIPWTIRSPTELAVLCLEAMGEAGYEVHLPPGLNYPGPFVPNLPNVSGTNPPVNWDGVPPAQALQELADRYGCRVVYRLSTDSVWVGPPGQGDALPPGSVYKRSPSLKSLQAPDSVGVIGSPTRYQVRLALEPVGKEWDGSYQPIDQLSYAPMGPGQQQVWTVTPVSAPGPGITYQVQVFPPPTPDHPIPGAAIVSFTAQTTSLADCCNGLANAFNIAPQLQGILTAKGNILNVLVTVNKAGDSIDIIPNNEGAGHTTAAITQAPQKPGPDWGYCLPPLFPTVVPTTRLTKLQAQTLARESVWRCYRITGTDVDGKPGVNVPGFGRVMIREQLVLQDTQVDQVIPQPRNPQILDANKKPTVINFYNGFSKDKPHAVYGSMSRYHQNRSLGYMYASPPAGTTNANTPVGSQIPTSSTIDPVEQLVIFSDYVYLQGNGVVLRPTLTLQTAVLVRDPDTNQVVAFTRLLPLPQSTGTGPKMEHHPDIQLEVTSLYDNKNKLLAFTILDGDPIIRANYYLQAAAAQYKLSGGQTVEYNGIVEVDLDGLTQQITWQIGGGGFASTTVSQNNEHSIYYPPYPARRRAEMLIGFDQRLRRDGKVDLWEPPEP